MRNWIYWFGKLVFRLEHSQLNSNHQPKLLKFIVELVVIIETSNPAIFPSKLVKSKLKLLARSLIGVHQILTTFIGKTTNSI